jgi:deazaflavin-dependent oxidoreductase (nitroreductase family)
VASSQSDPTPTRYRKPGWLTRNVFNPTVGLVTRMGLSLKGSRVLEVPGRRTGEPRRVPVNLLVLDDRQYLVAPRGTTEWVRNVRANGGRLDLLLGRNRTHHVATELADDDKDKVDVLRAYLKRWKAEVGIFFEGVGPDSSDEEIRAVAGNHPVFEIEQA